MNRINWKSLLTAARRIIPLAAGMVVVVLVIAWLSGAFHAKIDPGEAPPPVRRLAGRTTDVVQRVTQPRVEEAIGTLKSSSRTAISSKILASIESVSVAAGDEVAPGQELVRLSSQEYDARLRQSEQALAAGRATREEAELAMERAERLRAQDPGAIAQVDLDRTSRLLNVARANELRLEQGVTEAKVLLSYTTIAAPKSGRVVDRLAEPGDTARPGEPLLVLYDASALRLEAPVAERRAMGLEVGQKLTVRIDALDRELAATVDEIVPQAEAPSRSFLVKVALPPSEGLFEGMFGRLLIPAGMRRHLCLPTAALVEVGQLQFVDVVRDDDTLERRLVRTGRLGMEGRCEVLSGVEAGERVLLQNSGASSP